MKKNFARCGEPENINDKSHTAPSRRLEDLSGRFKKTVTDINVAQEIEVGKMRESCPIFNEWITELENLKH